MVVFLGDIAFYMATLIFAVGIYMLHHAKHHDSEKSKLLSNGGYVVTTIALIGMLCTGYYWVKYFYDGSYKTSSTHSMQQEMMGGNGMRINHQMIGQCIAQMPEGAKIDESVRERMKSCVKNQATMQEDGNNRSQDDPEPHK